jgi:2-hydroxychromene-2-carboxylate isomerase
VYGFDSDAASRHLGAVMSLKGLLSPAVSAWWLSAARLERQRARAERTRRARGEPHRIDYFHQADDPHAALAAAALPELARRYAVEIVPRVVGAPSDAVAPERARLLAWSRQDAARLARRHGLAFDDPGAQPAADAVAATVHALLDAIDRGRFVDEAAGLGAAMWARVGSSSGTSPTTASSATGSSATAPRDAPARDRDRARLAEAEALRTRLGHYLGGTFHYGGEWYWGIDRLHHLETRLRRLGAARGDGGPMFPPDVDPVTPFAAAHPGPIEFWYSLRSPYSAIVAPRVLRLAELSGVPLRLRGVLPMVMRGLPVPPQKRRYIATDAAREARLRGIDFGRLVDPVGRPAERGLALAPLARRAGVEGAYLLSFMRGTWAEGLDAGTDRGLRRIAERAGLAWTDCVAALADDGWRAEVEANRVALFERGLWGVPSMAVGEVAVWGQDRLWAIHDALRATPTRGGPTR